MLNLETLEKFDSQGMFKVYDKWPDIAQEYYEKKLLKIDIKNLDHIVFAGMGGSGTIGDIFSAILSKTNIHVSVVKGYLLPKTVDEKTLVVTTSVSGNTLETLTVLENAKKIECKTLSFSSGGKMTDYCVKNNLENFNIPKIHSPRASLTVFLYSILNVLEYVIPIKRQDVIESISQLQETRDIISSSNLTEKNQALMLAEWITDISLIYYPAGLQASAIRFKSSLQENAKLHAIIEDVVEASHNGIVAWERKSNVKPILIQGSDDYIKTKERWNIIKEYFNKNNIEYNEIFSGKSNILSKLIHLIYVLDYTSIYRAVLSKVDPSPTNSIDFVKERL